jgi:pimeloyl-ACP methyl ester carboxylesterase
MDRARVDGATLEYSSRGSGEPVLLIHGAHIGDGLKPLVSEEPLADRYRLILYHRRGYAGSDRASHPFSFEEQAADARALLEALGVERAHVVGHSSGAAIALQLALDSSEFVQSLALLEPPLLAAPGAEQFAQAGEGMVQRWSSGDKEGAVDEFLAAVSAPDYRRTLDGLLPGAFEQAVRDSDTFFGIEFPSLPEWKFGTEEAKRVRPPVLLVSGDESLPWFSEGDELLEQWLPQTERAVINGSNHLFQLAGHAAPLAEKLASFFARHPIK